MQQLAIGLTVKVEKTELAKKLEKELGISWDLAQGYADDAGYDLRSTKELVLAPGQTAMIPIGLHFELPSPDWEIQIRPRSGLAAKQEVTVLNAPGTVDYNYREEVGVILHNVSKQKPYYIKPGYRIAQACIRWVPAVEFENKKVERTARKGFGSTGIQ